MISQSNFKWIQLPVLSLVMFCSSGLAAQQDSEITAEQILNRFVKVTGGRKSREKVTARLSTGKLIYEVGGQKIDATFSIDQMAPDLSRLEVEIPSFGTVVIGFDGEKGWTLNPQSGDEVFDETRSEAVAVGGSFHGIAQWRKYYKSVELGKSEKINGSEAHRVNCTTKSGMKFAHFFDKKTGLHVKSLEPAQNPQLSADVLEVVIDDYREVDGVQYPFRIQQTARGSGNFGDIIQTFVYEKIQHSKSNDIKKFEIPKSIKSTENDFKSESKGKSKTDKSKPNKQKNQAISVDTVADNINAGTGGLAIDRDGAIYTSDFGSRLGGGGKGGDKIFRISDKGKAERFCGDQLGASGSVFDDQGRLFQANIRGNRINIIAANGKVSEFCRKGLSNPVGVVFDAKGNLLVCNCGGGSIQKISPDGESKTLVKNSLLKCPNGIAIGNDGTLFVSNFMNGDVVKISPDGSVSRLASLPGNNNGHLVFHRGVLFVVARSAHQIYRVTLDGKTALIAGTGKRGYNDGNPFKAAFSFPNAICVSRDGKYLFVNEVSDTKGDAMNLAPTRIRRIELSKQQKR